MFKSFSLFQNERFKCIAAVVLLQFLRQVMASPCSVCDLFRETKHNLVNFTEI